MKTIEKSGLHAIYMVIVLVGTVIALGCDTINPAAAQTGKQVLVHNQTQLSLVVDSKTFIAPYQMRSLSVTGNVAHIEASGNGVYDGVTNIWSGVELRKKITPDTKVITVKYTDFP